jgi:hypothetical protein
MRLASGDVPVTEPSLCSTSRVQVKKTVFMFTGEADQANKAFLTLLVLALVAFFLWFRLK